MPSWVPRSKLEWAYFGSTATQAVAIIPAQVTILVVYLQWVNSVVYQVPLAYVTPLTLGTTALGALYQLALTLDAYRIKNNIQLFVQCVCNICLSIATVMQYSQIKEANRRILINHDMYGTPFAKHEWKFWDHVSPALITCIVVSCACSVAMCLFAYGLYREFSWALYEQVSPDRKMRLRYFAYQIYLVILKFTPFFIISFILLYDLIDVHYVEPEFSLTMAIIPVALIHVGLAVYFVRIETFIGMSFVLVGHVAEIVYLVSRIVVLNSRSRLANTLLKDEMVFMAVVALGFSAIAFTAGSICVTNFRKGLKPLVLGQVQRKRPNNDFENDYQFQRLNHNVVAAPEQARRFALD
ncbi:hypothetical protein DPSP01_009157 [Paraphaeosphaeria sporulosa]|uniref:Uncharacterized protein n=1 Tax=Paraphaeosphaeria sporulosa TaxID=1460663 RepID=A0A177CJF6_9PLEO|nr:uncharacterized protein CC84DRAFT_1216359 [Paraphaeosphaeria sporulosa]OAG07391.1 hypothetical protein CC84DRAFT_1216359 [Paraphaeosphaeria sporulosa]